MVGAATRSIKEFQKRLDLKVVLLETLLPDALGQAFDLLFEIFNPARTCKFSLPPAKDVF